MEWNAKVMQKMEKIGCDESAVLSTFNCVANCVLNCVANCVSNCVALYNYHAPASILIVNYNRLSSFIRNYTGGSLLRIIMWGPLLRIIQTACLVAYNYGSSLSN
jgi:hypothetical protein